MVLAVNTVRGSTDQDLPSAIRAGRYTNLEYFLKYHGINNYYGI